jgi:hypothetical protein
MKEIETEKQMSHTNQSKYLNTTQPFLIAGAVELILCLTDQTAREGSHLRVSFAARGPESRQHS